MDWQDRIPFLNLETHHNFDPKNSALASYVITLQTYLYLYFKPLIIQFFVCFDFWKDNKYVPIKNKDQQYFDIKNVANRNFAELNKYVAFFKTPNKGH